MEHSEADPPFVLPGVRPWLISCDESGMDGARFCGFGTLWMAWDRRGDFALDIARIASARGMKVGVVDGIAHEFKWSKVKNQKLGFYKELVDYFFQRPWLCFHCMVVRKADVKREMHKDYAQAKQKHFTKLLTNKIERALKVRRRKFRVWVDPLPTRYAKAHEVVGIVANNVLNHKFGKLHPVDQVIEHQSHDTPSIQLCDLLLGAVMSAWQEESSAPGKLELRRWIAQHLGWTDLRADTMPEERKFNIWFLCDPNERPSDVVTRSVELKALRAAP
jgi:hypothetical protein